ncbi:MAG: LytR/AlgR family response regulator transcription factor [Luteibaculum sp.]
MVNWWRKLSEPFPESSSTKENTLQLLWISLFVTAFLFVLQPFGISGSDPNTLWVCLGFGAVTFVCSLSFHLFSKYILRIRSDLPTWTLGKWILSCILLLLWIALGNFMFLSALSGGTWEEFALLRMIGYTILVGVFPITFLGLYTQLKAHRNNNREAESLRPYRKHKGQAESKSFEINEGLKLTEDQIIYVEAAQNYVEVHFWEESKHKREVVRATMQQMEDLLTGNVLFRCHRSYIINLTAIEEVNGNAQGLQLALNAPNCPSIPVARSYIKRFRNTYQ